MAKRYGQETLPHWLLNLDLNLATVIISEAQVGLPHLFIGDEMGGPLLHDDRAGLQDITPI